MFCQMGQILANHRDIAPFAMSCASFAPMWTGAYTIVRDCLHTEYRRPLSEFSLGLTKTLWGLYSGAGATCAAW